MSSYVPISRRGLLKTSLVMAPLALTAVAMPRGASLARTLCNPTAGQGEGPFYPPRIGRPGNDLFLSPQKDKRPYGEPIIFSGRVTDAKCRPLSSAVVEIWQADHQGRYLHPNEAPGARDPHFAYWGTAVTNANGAYLFRTIFPGAYGSGAFRRTPHIHVKVRVDAALALTTQLYFPGHPLNNQDFLFNDIPLGERATVLAREVPKKAPGGLRQFRFEIAL